MPHGLVPFARIGALALALAVALVLAGPARADSIPIVSLTDVGPDQEVPTDRAFYVAGEAAPTLQLAQAIVVRKGSPSLFGDDGPSCGVVLAGLHLNTASSTVDDDSEDDTAPAPSSSRARFEAGVHAAFELFPHASHDVRDLDVLVTAAWHRSDDDARRYQVLVPHDPRVFSAGYAYCLFVVTTDRAQVLDDDAIGDAVDAVARKIVACGDKSSCQDEALDDFETRMVHALRVTRSLGDNDAKAIAGKLKDAARAELGAATGLIEARDHLDDRWHRQTDVMTPVASAIWLDTDRDPFAHAVASLLARSAALLPQVKPGRGGSAIALYTPDGKLQVRALQILDDGRSIRVASSKAPAGDQAHVLTATTDLLAAADAITIFDLLQLGASKVRIDKDWLTLNALGDRVAAVGLDGWSGDDAAFLAAATVRVRRLADFVDSVTTNVACRGAGLASNDVDGVVAERRHLGEWLACQHVDASKLEELAALLDEVGREEQAWKASQQKLAARAKRIATVATTAPVATRVGFASRTWAFSYVTPVVGYAGIVRPEESFGLFYVGAQIHLDPNPVDDIAWRDGVTIKDLRRAVALEVAVAPYSSFGPDRRYAGIGGVPPIFVGLAAHVVPYTSLTIGGTIVDRRRSSLAQEDPHAVFAPYIGLTLQLNVPDLLRNAAHPASDTMAGR